MIPPPAQRAMSERAGCHRRRSRGKPRDLRLAARSRGRAHEGSGACLPFERENCSVHVPTGCDDVGGGDRRGFDALISVALESGSAIEHEEVLGRHGPDASGEPRTPPTASGTSR